MTIDAATPLASYTISGTGPYALSWPYDTGAIEAALVRAGVETAIDSADFSVSPTSTTTGGNLTLGATFAAAHAGETLRIRRVTPVEQGWQGSLGGRELGLEVSLDTLAKAVQDALAANDTQRADLLALGAAIAAVDPTTYVTTATAQTITGLKTFIDQLNLQTTDNAAAAGPNLSIKRVSASPAANDNLGQVLFYGNNSAGDVTTYARLKAGIDNPAAGAEAGSLVLRSMVGGVETDILGVYGQGYVGIGNGIPEEPLDVTGTIKADDLLLQSTATDSGIGPVLDLYRNSASPAALDSLGAVNFNGKNDAGTKTTYAMIYGWISDPTAGSENGRISVKTMDNGTLQQAVMITGTGKVGIGTTDPSLFPTGFNDLVVGTGLPASGGITVAGAPLASVLFVDALDGFETQKSFIRQDTTQQALILGASFTRNQIVMTSLDSAYPDRVGIGTLTPGYKLDVAGDVNVSGGFYVGGVPFTGGAAFTAAFAVTGSDLTIANSTASQKLLNTSANGALAVEPGMYRFRALILMSGLSGTVLITFNFGGTATIGLYDAHVVTRRGTVATGGYTSASAGAEVSNTDVTIGITGTGVGFSALVEGMIEITAAGTLIPQIKTSVGQTAAAVKAGSAFDLIKLGDTGNTGGTWT